MQVREIMTAGVECIPPDMTIKDASARMKALDVGFLPVCDNDRLVGTVTDRDIVIRGIAEGRTPTTYVREIMSRDVYYCYEDDDVSKVAERMREKEVRRMLILNRDKRLTGVVSIGDVSKVQESIAGEALKDICEAA